MREKIKIFSTTIILMQNKSSDWPDCFGDNPGFYLYVGFLGSHDPGLDLLYLFFSGASTSYKKLLQKHK